jgi:molybdopterin converting factor small subunit
VGPRETLTIRLPAALAEAIRDEARLRGKSVGAVVTQLMEAALERRPVRVGARHADLISTLFD